MTPNLKIDLFRDGGEVQIIFRRNMRLLEEKKKKRSTSLKKRCFELGADKERLRTRGETRVWLIPSVYRPNAHVNHRRAEIEPNKLLSAYENMPFASDNLFYLFVIFAHRTDHDVQHPSMQ